jgi:putative endonuclease
MQKRDFFLGEFSEKIACNFLESKGYSIVKTRYKNRHGEVDIIAEKSGKIILIEVKYRKQFDDFEGIVDDKKLERMFKTAEEFLENRKEWQFDIIFLNAKYEVYHLENVIGC